MVQQHARDGSLDQVTSWQCTVHTLNTVDAHNASHPTTNKQTNEQKEISKQETRCAPARQMEECNAGIQCHFAVGRPRKSTRGCGGAQLSAARSKVTRPRAQAARRKRSATRRRAIEEVWSLNTAGDFVAGGLPVGDLVKARGGQAGGGMQSHTSDRDVRGRARGDFMRAWRRDGWRVTTARVGLPLRAGVKASLDLGAYRVGAGFTYVFRTRWCALLLALF